MYSKNKASKGSIGIVSIKGRIHLNLPRQWFGGNQERRPLSLEATEANMALASRVARRLEMDFQDGKLKVTLPDGSTVFNEEHYVKVLTEYNIIAKLKTVDLKLVQGGLTSDEIPPKPKMSLLDVWDKYCEHRKEGLHETTYEIQYRGTYRNFLVSAIEATGGEDAIEIKNWLLKERNRQTVCNLLSLLEKAYQIALRQRLVSFNPYEGVMDDIPKKEKKKRITVTDEPENEDLLNKSKAFTWDEALAIMDFLKDSPRYSCWYPFVAFKFLTGCRTGEAIGLCWCDVRFDRDIPCITFKRAWNCDLQIYKPLKSEKEKEKGRIFPMPKDGELWNLLKSLEQGKPSEPVLKSKTGKKINDAAFQKYWSGAKTKNQNGKIYEIKGIIPELIEQGKVSKYLPGYNTRHTFVTHQIFDLGRDEKIVSAWCGHGEAVSSKHYQDIADRASQINPDLPVNKPTQQVSSEVDEMKSIIKSLQEQLKTQSEVIASLQEQLKNK